MRNIKDIKDFIAEEGLSLEEATDLRNEIALELKRLALINQNLTLQDESLETTEEAENNLIFVPTTGGNIRVLEEIEHIDPEYYERFSGLFQSIKDGTFKKVRRFRNSALTTGLCEVKDFKTRVIFKRLNSNSYAIISAFIKKTDNDKGYRNMLESRYGDYLNIEEQLRSNLDSEEFMSLQKGYEEELFRKISSTKTSPILKVKVGE